MSRPIAAALLDGFGTFSEVQAPTYQSQCKSLSMDGMTCYWRLCGVAGSRKMDGEVADTADVLEVYSDPKDDDTANGGRQFRKYNNRNLPTHVNPRV